MRHVISKRDIEAMPLQERIAAHEHNADVHWGRASLWMKVSIAFLCIAVVAQVVNLLVH